MLTALGTGHVLAAATSKNSGGLGSLLFPVLIALAAVLFIRQSRRAKAKQAATQTSVEPGRSVVTRGGIYGTVIAVEDGVIDLEVAPAVIIKVMEQAVGRVLPVPDSSEAPEPRAEAGPVPPVPPDEPPSPESPSP